jgi:hypothetical protein
LTQVQILAQKTLLDDVNMFSKAFEEAGRRTDGLGALLVSTLLLEGSDPSWGFDLEDNTIDSLPQHINRVYEMGDAATAETLQRNLIIQLIQGDTASVRIEKEVLKLGILHASYAETVSELFEHESSDILPISPLFRRPGLLTRPYWSQRLAEYEYETLNAKSCSKVTPVLHRPEFLKEPDCVSVMVRHQLQTSGTVDCLELPYMSP